MMLKLDTIVKLCKQRGFVFPSAEIHGGLGNSFDYGALGTQLKRNIADRWWRRFVVYENDCFGVDSSILLPTKVLEKSGHLDHFHDPMIDCKKCNKRFRADHLATPEKSVDQWKNGKCPCGSLKEWGQDMSDVRDFNLLFETRVGPVAQTASMVYLRPETAQGSYVNFANIFNSMRAQVPFGIGQIGKAFRNEITPGHFTFRTLEFEQMELQWFCREEESNKWFEHWLEQGQDWLENEIGLRKENLRVIEHPEDDLAHYAKRTSDIEYRFPSLGWGELWGFADRGTYDLTQHQLQAVDNKTNEKFTPSVIEPAVGLNRLVLAVLCDAYHVEKVEATGEQRTVLRFQPDIAPYTVAVIPLIQKNDQLKEMSREIYQKLCKRSSVGGEGSPVLETGNARIGKQYRRHDEIGTPYCITVDFDSISDQKVTIRDRDTTNQVRIDVETILDMPMNQWSKFFPKNNE